MDPEVLAAIRDMLMSRKVLCLAATIDGEASASLLPFAVSSGFRGVYVQASTLARHSRALRAGAQVGLLFHDPDVGEADPLQLSRLTLQATVEPLERESAAFDAASRVFVSRFPAAETTLELADFTLYHLAFGRGRFVAGFAQAYNVGPGSFDELVRL